MQLSRTFIMYQYDYTICILHGISMTAPNTFCMVLVCPDAYMVVVREGDDRRADPEDHARMDLAVREGLAGVVFLEVAGLHGDHAGLLFLAVDYLDQAC